MRRVAGAIVYGATAATVPPHAAVRRLERRGAVLCRDRIEQSRQAANMTGKDRFDVDWTTAHRALCGVERANARFAARCCTSAAVPPVAAPEQKRGDRRRR